MGIMQRRSVVVEIANFLGDGMTSEQCNTLLDEIREWDLDSKFYIHDYVNGGPLFTALSEHLSEIGEY